MEDNTKKSLVIFAIAKRQLEGSVDLTTLSEFVQLHTVRGFGHMYACEILAVKLWGG